VELSPVAGVGAVVVELNVFVPVHELSDDRIFVLKESTYVFVVKSVEFIGSTVDVGREVLNELVPDHELSDDNIEKLSLIILPFTFKFPRTVVVILFSPI
jgi:hypothetical protein